MKTWDICYTDGTIGHVEADQINVGGTVLMFIRVSGIADAKGKTPGEPIAFVDLSNPGVRCVNEHMPNPRSPIL